MVMDSYDLNTYQHQESILALVGDYFVIWNVSLAGASYAGVGMFPRHQ
jgi:hypothetical protein